MANILDEVCEEIVSWLSKTRFKEAYIFGSLIHKGGIQFEPQRSDVDLVCVFPEHSTYLERSKIVIEALQPTGDMNLKLLQLFGRTDASKPIVSVVSVSSFELRLGLHKDKSPQFFSHNDFFSVLTRKCEPIGEEHFHMEAAIEGALDSIREAQRVRNKALAVSPSQICALCTYDGIDPLPKELARCAAQTRWALTAGLPPSDRFDMNEGFLYTLQLLTSRRNEAPEVDNLLCRLMMRMNGRGQSLPLSACDLVLLFEILAEDATALIQGKDVILDPSVPRKEPPLSEDVKQQAMVRAGFRCSFPGCGVPLGEGGIGVVAHINSPSGGVANRDGLGGRDVSDLQNLIVLCPTHHRVVDMDPEKYPAELLRTWNAEAAASITHAEFSGDNLFTMFSMINRLRTPGAEPGVAGEHDLCPACERRTLEFTRYGVGPLGVNNAWYTCKSCGYEFQTHESSED